jgi:hypothetical protein
MRFKVLLIAVSVVGASAVAAIVWRDRLPTNAANVLAVPSGDHEIAWFNTTTSGQTWEDFVSGISGAMQAIPELELDDSRAFLERTTAVPEVVLSWKNRPGKLHIRWYKQTSETGNKEWIDALAERDPAPLAIMGGGSSDRARDLAHDLNERTNGKGWKGRPPLLLITTATANEVTIDAGQTPRSGNDAPKAADEGTEAAQFQLAPTVKLTEVYPERSFRFCFTNEQMARAVIDFVWHMPDLRPVGGPPNAKGEEPPPIILPMQWEDDPYSIDLSEKFRQAVKLRTADRYKAPFISHPPYSVGLFDRVNRVEEEYARIILEEPLRLPGQRSLLILPTSTTPARRVLRALTGESPLIGKYLVAVNGDAISLNDVYRDGELQWNIRDVPVPLVFFSHENPIGWNERLPPPTATDQVLLFADIVRVLAQCAYTADGIFVRDADAFRDNLRAQQLIKFDVDGNRKDGSEFVVCLRPEITDSGQINAQASLEVWNRLTGGAWKQVRPSHPLFAPYLSRPHRPAGNGP